MKRRGFLQLAGVAALAGSTPVITACSRKEKAPDFWQVGNYPPVVEEITATELTVDGAIPPQLNGLYVRNGPNSHTGVANHFFSGDGMLHGIQLENGKANWYRNRYVRTPLLDSTPSRFSAPKLENTTSAVSLIHHGGRLLSLGEFGYPYEIDPADLSTKGLYRYHNKLNISHTAHPKIDPVTGELLFFGYNVTAPYLTYMRANAKGEMVQSEQIKTNGPAMMHDFAVTENYVIFMEMPVLFSWFKAITGSPLPFAWDNDAVCRFGVMPIHGSNKDLRWFDVKPGFIFHTMNAFEQGNELVLDAARYERLWVKDSSDFNHPAYLTRYTLNLATGSSTETQVHGQSMEFPQIHRAHWGRPYRYGYGLSSEISMGEMSYEGAAGFIKFDLQSGNAEQHRLPAYNAPNEPFFVPVGAAEDAGFLLSYVYDRNTNTSDLWILDAAAISAPPVAKIKLPVRVPQGFHGVWVPA